MTKKDAACFRASAETDPANNLESKPEACQITKANDQPLGLEGFWSECPLAAGPQHGTSSFRAFQCGEN